MMLGGLAIEPEHGGDTIVDLKKGYRIRNHWMMMTWSVYLGRWLGTDSSDTDADDTKLELVTWVNGIPDIPGLLSMYIPEVGWNNVPH